LKTRIRVSVSGVRIPLYPPLHDAILIEAPLGELEAQTAAMQSYMAKASRLVLDGFELRSDAEYTRYPDAFGKRQDPMWELVNSVIRGQP